jgi:hypothetical protein
MLPRLASNRFLLPWDWEHPSPEAENSDISHCAPVQISFCFDFYLSSIINWDNTLCDFNTLQHFSQSPWIVVLLTGLHRQQEQQLHLLDASLCRHGQWAVRPTIHLAESAFACVGVIQVQDTPVKEEQLGWWQAAVMARVPRQLCTGLLGHGFGMIEFF